MTPGRRRVELTGAPSTRHGDRGRLRAEVEHLDSTNVVIQSMRASGGSGASFAFEGVAVSEYDSERESETSVDRYDKVDLDGPFPDDEDDAPDLPGFTEEDRAALADLPPEADNLPPEADPDYRP